MFKRFPCGVLIVVIVSALSPSLQAQTILIDFSDTHPTRPAAASGAWNVIPGATKGHGQALLDFTGR